jgi:putative ABC transport system permease protein
MNGFKQKENMAMAFQTLMAHKFRSFLTVLGIIIGVLTVVVIASILTGMRQSIISTVQEFGTDNVFAFHLGMGPRMGGRRPREEMMRKPLTVADALAIKDQCAAVKDVTWQGFPRRTQVSILYQGNVGRSFDFNGVPANYAAISNTVIAKGRFFSESEDNHGLNIVVLGPDIAEALFPHSEPLGKRILINNRPFTVIGICEKSKSGAFGDTGRDRAVLVPYRSMMRMMPSEDWHLARPSTRSRASCGAGVVSSQTKQITSTFQPQTG